MGWSEENQKIFHDKLYQIANTLYKTEEDKQAFADCGLAKAKEQLPYGFGSTPDDSIKAIFMRIGKSCAQDVGTTVDWTPEIESELKAKIAASPIWKGVQPTDKAYICNCYVHGLKNLYPNGFNDTIGVEQKQRIVHNCMLELLNKRKKGKQAAL